MNRILSAINKWARIRPNQIAFTGHDVQGNVVDISYQVLMEQIEQSAHQLSLLHTQCIALKAENSLEWMVIDLACMHANICLIPVPTFFSERQIQHVLHESGASVLIGDWEQYGQPVASVYGLSAFTRNATPAHQRLAGSIKVTFTSGSTGTPKGVCLSIDNLNQVSQALAHSVDIGANKHLVFLPLSTLLENITGIYVPLLLGVTSLIFKGERIGLKGSNHFDAQSFTHALARYQPSSLVLTPALLLALIKIVQHQPQLATPLKFVAVGGARVAAELIEKAHQLSIPAFEGYGLSECASVVSLNTPKAMKAGSSGKILAHVTAKIEPDGELWVKGNNALGYLGEPFDSDWLATGDLADMDEQGFITLKGRKKNQIITSFGRNISPEWIESEAQTYLPGCSIIVTGEAQLGLTAVIIECEQMVEGIRQLNQTLPDYAKIERLIVQNNFANYPHWFTANGRAKRSIIEAWTREYLAQNASIGSSQSMTPSADLSAVKSSPIYLVDMACR